MHIQKSPSALRNGFTLVELLVVISIIIVLASLGFAGFNMAMDKAKRTSAQTCIAQLVTASNDFYEEYQALPLAPTATNDEEKLTDNQLMAVLLGLRSAEQENFKLESFFSFKNAKGKGNAAHDGILRTENRAELFGPWQNSQKSERYYRVVYDYDYDQEIREPNALGNELMFDVRALVYHAGKDGRVGGKYNDDNVYSWSKSN